MRWIIIVASFKLNRDTVIDALSSVISAYSETYLTGLQYSYVGYDTIVYSY